MEDMGVWKYPNRKFCGTHYHNNDDGHGHGYGDHNSGDSHNCGDFVGGSNGYNSGRGQGASSLASHKIFGLGVLRHPWYSSTPLVCLNFDSSPTIRRLKWIMIL